MKPFQLFPGLRMAVRSNRPFQFGRVLIAAAGVWASPVVAAEAGKPPADPASLPAPKRAVVPKLEGRVEIDGNLSEAVWARAAQLGPFVLSDDARPERERTIVRVWYDDTALYLGWTCDDTEIQATFTGRDSKFWEEEVAEFFVTAGDLREYFELQWNPLGGVFDAIIRNKLDHRGVSTNFTGDWSFTAKGMTSAVKLEGTAANANDKDTRWQVEVRVPFSDLGGSTPKPGAIWRANFYRFNRATGHPVEMLSWSPTLLPGFHQPTRFGYLEFGR